MFPVPHPFLRWGKSSLGESIKSGGDIGKESNERDTLIERVNELFLKDALNDFLERIYHIHIKKKISSMFVFGVNGLMCDNPFSGDFIL